MKKKIKVPMIEGKPIIYKSKNGTLNLLYAFYFETPINDEKIEVTTYINYFPTFVITNEVQFSMN